MTDSPPKVCILGAVERELAPLRRRLGHTAALPHEFIVTGVGKACAASAATAAILEAKATVLLQVGCGGAYPRSGLAQADVAVATSEVLADEGTLAADGFHDLRELGLPLLPGDLYNEIPTAFPPPRLWDDVLARVGALFRVVAGRLVTVSTGSGTDAQAAAWEARWQPLVESMEGAAVAFVGRKYDCPFVEVRGVSNFVGARDRSAWQIDGASEHAGEVAALLLASPLFLEAC